MERNVSAADSLADEVHDAPLSDRIVTELQRRIITGEIAIGDWLRHSAIAEEFGISRTPVREALRILSAQGIVTIVPHRGARVNGQSSRDIREIGDVRAELEGYAAELAAGRINDAQLERMQGAWQGFREIIGDLPAAPGTVEDPGARWVESNGAFHSVIVEASGNRHLEVAIHELQRRLPHNLAYAAYEGNSRLLAKNLQEHESIAAAIIDQDPRRARKLMTAHLRDSNEATARWVERNGTA